jgi:hypothetical protein
MQSADRIKELFNNAKLAVRPGADEQVFQDMLRAQQETKTNGPEEPVYASVDTAPRLWRITMRSPITKLAIAAVLVIACLMGMMMWNGTGSSVALASVLTRMEQVAVFSYQMSMTMTGQMQGVPMPMNQHVESTILTAQDLGTKMTLNVTDPNRGQNMRQEMYLLPQKKMMLSVMPDEKQYMQLDLDDAKLDNLQKGNNDPRAMVKLLMNCNYTSLGRSAIDGVQVEGFETTDPAYMAGIMGQVDVKLWVDAKTQLPVRSEMDMQTDQLKMHYIMHDFRWDVSVDPREFDPLSSGEYKPILGGPMKLPAVTEESAIHGLKLFADLTGRYPDELTMMGVMSQMAGLTIGDTPAAKQLRDEIKGLTPEEMGRKLADMMTPLQVPAGFYATLVGGKKDPAYYGKVVTPQPQDARQVLMRWKVSDDEYRVIFGSLHVETVKADVLAELEKTLPKQ